MDLRLSEKTYLWVLNHHRIRMQIKLEDFRQDYQRDKLLETDAADHPIAQFGQWLQAAIDAQLPEPNAMVLATSTPDGRPSARVLLLKEVTPSGFIFYTNYESRKGHELQQNPHAALVFNWLELHRQVRIEGLVERLPAEESTAYFQSRPKGSQIGAWASPQSQVIPDREVLEDKAEEIADTYAQEDVLPRPPHWGGYRLHPYRIEFWQGRSDRLHDRILYTLDKEDRWEKSRLAP